MTFSLFAYWFVLVWAAGWLFFPFARRLFPDFSDAGLAVSRVLFLCLWTLLAFWLGNAGVAPALSAWLYLALAGVGLGFWRRDFRANAAEIRARKRGIFAVETVFLGVFLLFFVLRGFWSDTNGNNGEKGMDGALVASLARADSLPTPNPYAAGSRLQAYYVFGHLETALLTVASGTTVRWSYNLMCAILPALCVSMLFSVGATLTRRLWGGAFVAFGVLFLGTLQPIFQWLHQDQWSETRFLRLDFFGVSRVLPNAINEFPFFTFNQGDLHAHYFNFQFQIAAIALALTFFLRPNWTVLALLGAVLGAQILTNTWDFIAYFLLFALALWNARATQKESTASKNDPKAINNHPTASEIHPSSSKKSSKAINNNPMLSEKGSTPEGIQSTPSKIQLEASGNTSTTSEKNSMAWPISRKLAATVLVLVGAIGLAAPFLLGLSSAASGPKPLLQPASPLREWLLMWGVWAFAWWNFLAWRAFPSRRFRGGAAVLGALILVAALAANWGYPEGVRAPYNPEALAAWKSVFNPARLVLPLILLTISVSVWAIFRGQFADARARFLAILASAGLFSLLFSEVSWAGFLGSAEVPGFDDFKRQDTVFKFGLQTWILWGTAATAGAFLSLKSWPKLFKIALVPIVLVMATSSVVAVHGRARSFSQFDRWDAWAHLQTPEKAAANWLETHVSRGQNILEAEQKEGGDYSVFTRYTHATGISTVVGPRAHTFQWAPANARDAGREWEAVGRRKEHARAIFEGVPNRADLLQDYAVRFIVFGELERAEYGEAALKSLQNDANLRQVAAFGAREDKHRVEIFEVK